MYWFCKISIFLNKIRFLIEVFFKYLLEPLESKSIFINVLRNLNQNYFNVQSNTFFQFLSKSPQFLPNSRFEEALYGSLNKKCREHLTFLGQLISFQSFLRALLKTGSNFRPIFLMNNLKSGSLRSMQHKTKEIHTHYKREYRKLWK